MLHDFVELCGVMCFDLWLVHLLMPLVAGLALPSYIDAFQHDGAWKEHALKKLEHDFR